MKPADQINTSASALSELSGVLPALAAQVTQTWLDTRKDGYSSSSFSEGTGSSNITATFLEPDGSEVELTVPQHTDSVGELVVQRMTDTAGEPIYVSLRQAASWLREAEQLAEKARGCLITAINPPVEKEPEPDPTQWCAVCARAKVMSPTFSVEAIRPGDLAKPRCSDCCGWAHDALNDPRLPPERPKAIIVKQAAGGRITTKDIEELLGGAA